MEPRASAKVARTHARALPLDGAALQRTLLAILRAHPRGLSEHALFRELARRGETSFDGDAFAGKLALFQAHFVLFNQLYALRDALRADHEADLEIGFLKIALTPYTPVQAEGLDLADPLRHYYANLDHLRTTRAEDVDQMLRSFWRRFESLDERACALAVLGLPPDADAATVKQRYRRLVFESHPDRGGDAVRLRELNAAMEQIQEAGP